MLPTGAQHVLRLRQQEAVVVELGGGLRSYEVGGRPVLDGYPADASPDTVRGQVLAPWPNRLRDGRYAWDGEQRQLPLTEPERATAIHGLVRWVRWQVVERSAERVVVEHVLLPQPGYPHVLGLRVDYALTPDGLRVSTTATNLGATDLPYGEGHHPYLAAGPGLRVDDAVLTAPAATRLTSDDRGLPTGREDVTGTPYDFRQGRRIGHLRVDSCFTDLSRDADGLARVRLVGPDGAGAELELDGAYRWLQLFTGDVVPAPRTRQGLAVEPMTCPPDALATGEDLVRLAPGASTSGTWGVRPVGGAGACVS